MNLDSGFEYLKVVEPDSSASFFQLIKFGYCESILGVVDVNSPVEGIAEMNEHGEYFYDAFIENIDKYQFNKILDVGNTTV